MILELTGKLFHYKSSLYLNNKGPINGLGMGFLLVNPITALEPKSGYSEVPPLCGVNIRIRSVMQRGGV